MSTPVTRRKHTTKQNISLVRQEDIKMLACKVRLSTPYQSKDTLLFQIGPLVQKILGFKAGHPPPLLSLNFQKINPQISETNHPINKNF